MEEHEKAHIAEKLQQLIKSTSFDIHLLSELRAQGVLSFEDEEVLVGTNLSPYDQIKLLYEIMKTRPNGYETLQKALWKTGQSSATDILAEIACPISVHKFSKRHGRITYTKDGILGRGCFNTKIFQGMISANKAVAVKQISREDIDVTQVIQEVSALVNLEKHENVIKYFNVETTPDFILIALELCAMNLNEWARSEYVSIEPVEILRQSTAGISHLHKHLIIHRDVKPANILLAENGDETFIVKITDFGISKKYYDDNLSFDFHMNTVGSDGWIAPEVIKALDTTRPGNAAQEIAMTFSSDVFSLGCVFYFVATKGLHPFGSPFKRQANIIDDKHSLNETDLKCNSKCLIQLIQSMLSHNSIERPSASQVLMHHIFWESKTKLQFLSELSFLLRSRFSAVDECILRMDDSPYVNWLDKLCGSVKVYLRVQGSQGCNVKRLVETIGYLENHYDDLPIPVKFSLGEYPEGFLEYWMSRFEDLLPSLWLCFKDLKGHSILRKYYNEKYI